jgi:hypothetical protein
MMMEKEALRRVTQVATYNVVTADQTVTVYLKNAPNEKSAR